MSDAYNEYHMSQAEVAEKLFLHKNSILDIERRALEKMRKMFDERGITYADLAPE